MNFKGLTPRLNQRPDYFYSPNILPLMQSLLSVLADLDFQFEGDLDTVMNSKIDEALKLEVIASLKQRHQERRSPYLRELAELERQIIGAAA
jgi:hypothetical protein